MAIELVGGPLCGTVVSDVQGDPARYEGQYHCGYEGQYPPFESVWYWRREPSDSSALQARPMVGRSGARMYDYVSS